MKTHPSTRLIALAGLAAALVFLAAPSPAPQAEKEPPFKLTALKEAAGVAGEKLFEPRNPYNIFINYELGMHCVGFDISYCCVIPPYNSVQAQAVKSGENGGLPRLLSPEDKVKLYYFIWDNTYSEGNKMKYWGVTKDINGDGRIQPNDNIANYVWTHLFIYKDLKGTLPENPKPADRLHVGIEIPVAVDHGPSGKPVAGGFLDYAGPRGNNIVFTDTLIPEVQNVPLTLTASHLWDALGLPLTAFYDSRRKGTLRTVVQEDFQPFQYATVQLRDENGRAVGAAGNNVEFFGTEPVDLPSCYACHSSKGVAAELSRKQGHTLFDKEYAYWKDNYPDISEFMARLSAASINILELHDANAKTNFLRDYQSNAASNRLGEVGPVNCADCHGDNISGNLQTPRPRATGYKAVKAKPMTASIHAVHAVHVPMPDKAGRTQNCQACHPMHWQNPAMNNPATNRMAVIDEFGRPRFTDGDQREGGGGCYLRRDATANPHVDPPFFLNDIGRWYFENVSTRDAEGAKLREIRGLMCTDCHNMLTQALYDFDDLSDTTAQKGKTLRNKPIREVVKAVAGGDAKRFAEYMADPKINAPGNPVNTFWGTHAASPMVKATKDAQGNLKLLPWNAKQGDSVPYDAAAGGGDWWLASTEPHCANCHLAPFVESEGGAYFPLDQPNKYALYRYSKAHALLACQSCHQSIHGLYPVRYEGEENSVDVTSHQQALKFSPDDDYAGPVTCAACHTVNAVGVPVQLKGTDYYADYWAAVVLLHGMRGEDFELSQADLMKKHPYAKAKAVVAQGWK